MSWKHVCTGGGAPFDGNVHALQVIGDSLYIGGTFAGVDGLLHAHALVRCDLTSGIPTSTTVDPAHDFVGAVYALTADNAGNLYAGGGFSNLENNPASDNIVELTGAGWTNLGSGGGACGCAVDSFVRSLADDGTTLYVGADSVDIAGIAQADHVAGWNGSSWHALGSNAAGTDGCLPVPISVYALFAAGGHVYASGSRLNVGGDPTADLLADFDGTSWKPVGSNGAGDGALNGVGESIAIFGGILHVGGNFTKAGGDALAHGIARYTGVPNNAITLGKVKQNTAKGTAKLSATVPGAGALTLTGKGVKKVQQSVAGAGQVVLKVAVKGKSLRKLKARGKLKVTVTVTFTPTGGTPRSVPKTVKLVLKHH